MTDSLGLVRGITFSGVEKAYGDTVAVAGLDLTIAAGEFFALLGPSGSGKTTALRMVAGLDAPDAGSITIGDRDAESLGSDSRNVAMVGVDFGLIPNRDARFNLAFPLMVAGTESAEIDERVAGIAERMRLLRRLDRRPGELSEGERQGVTMGRALVRDVDILLFDEPLARLDARARERALVDLRRVRDERATTIIYVTNDQAEAMALADSVGVLHGGALRQVGPPAEVYNHPADTFVAGFLGSPPMNLVRGWVTMSGDEVAVELGSRVLRIPAAAAPVLVDRSDAEVVVGVRPEDLHAGAMPDDAGVISFGGTVEFVEYTGTYRFVHFSNDAAPLAGAGPAAYIARMNPSFQAAQGDHAAFGVRIAKLRFFDPEDGTAL